MTCCGNLGNSKYSQVNEELEEFDECHDGEAEPQTENTAGVRDVLQQLTP